MDTGNSAMFNRYSYCYNDPVNCTDPDGEAGVFGAAIAAVVGATAGAVINGGAEYLSQRANGGDVNFGSVFAKAAIGAVTGAVVGSGDGLVAGAITGANFGAIGGGLNVAVNAASGDTVTTGAFLGAMAAGAVLGGTNIKVAPRTVAGAADDALAAVANSIANTRLDAATPVIAETFGAAFSDVNEALGTAASLPDAQPIANCGTDGTVCY